MRETVQLVQFTRIMRKRKTQQRLGTVQIARGLEKIPLKILIAVV